MRQIRLTEDVLTVLSTMRIEEGIAEHRAFITKGNLARPLYVKVNIALEALGGTWERRAKAHVFEVDPTDRFEQAILTGVVDKPRDLDKELGFFPTSPSIAELLIKTVDIKPGMTVLEPSVGDGALIRALPSDLHRVAVVEIDHGRLMATVALLPQLPNIGSYRTMERDFMTLTPSDVIDPRDLARGFDRVVMNPPFARQQDIDHVRHAFAFLRPGGVLGAIMAAGVRYRENAKAVEFRAFVKANEGRIADLPEGTFVESCTSVSTVMVTLRRSS